MAKKKDRNKKDDEPIQNYWRRNKPDLAVKDYRWRIYATPRSSRGRKVDSIRIDSMVTSMSWEDALIQTVSISLVNPFESNKLNIELGSKVTAFYSGKSEGAWKKLWTLRVTSVTESADGETMEVEAADELEWLKKSKDDFSYRKGKGKSRDKRPDGWYAHQIARDVAKRYGIKVGALAKGTHQIKNLTKESASPLSVIEEAYKKEREETGFKYVIRMTNGKLFVTRLRRSRELLIYGGQALDGQVTRRLGERMATELTVRGQIKDDGTDEKQTVTVRATKKVRQRFGFIHDFWNLEGEEAKSEADLRKLAKRELAERQEPEEEVTITVPGYPDLRRGDAIRLNWPQADMKELVYVTDASHSVSPGDYTTDLTLSFDEYYVDEEGEKIREKLCKKAEEKGRKKPAYCRENYDPFAPAKKRPKKNKNKGNTKKRAARSKK